MCLTTKRAGGARFNKNLARDSTGQTHPRLIDLTDERVAAMHHAQAAALEEAHFAHPQRFAAKVAEARDHDVAAGRDIGHRPFGGRHNSGGNLGNDG